MALEDLHRELVIISDAALIRDCKSQIERIERRKLEAGTDEKANIMKEMESHLVEGSEVGGRQ